MTLITPTYFIEHHPLENDVAELTKAQQAFCKKHENQITAVKSADDVGKFNGKRVKPWDAVQIKANLEKYEHLSNNRCLPVSEVIIVVAAVALLAIGLIFSQLLAVNALISLCAFSLLGIIKIVAQSRLSRLTNSICVQTLIEAQKRVIHGFTPVTFFEEMSYERIEKHVEKDPQYGPRTDGEPQEIFNARNLTRHHYFIGFCQQRHFSKIANAHFFQLPLAERQKTILSLFQGTATVSVLVLKEKVKESAYRLTDIWLRGTQEERDSRFKQLLDSEEILKEIEARYATC